MAKKIFKIIGIVLGSITLGVGIAYALIAVYFGKRFMPNTVINGIDVNTMSVDEVNDIFISKNEPYSISLNFMDGSSEVLNGEDFDYCFDYSGDLNKILSSQNQFEWPYYALYRSEYDAGGEALFDEGKVIAVLSSLPEYSDTYDNSSAEVRIEKKSHSFFLSDERKPELDAAKATDDVLKCISESKAVCDLTSDYNEPSSTDEQQQMLDKWDSLNKVLNAKITLFDDDIELIIDKAVLSSWIKTNSNNTPLYDAEGNVCIDESMVDRYIKVISKRFATDGCDRKWEKYKGGTVMLPCTWDGYIIDEEAEKQALINSVLKGKTEKREPKYSQLGNGHGNKEVGDTYVEVDIGSQKMYFFDKGKLKLESDIVSGCKKYHNDTPSMISKIYFMQEGRTLRGENYATFVYYWMAFYNHYGLHDATWRGKFGNDIYLTDGSHGCVNLPKDVAAKLYEMVEVGTPVVLYE